MLTDLNPLLFVDSYKLHHFWMYPKEMSKLYSNLTCRKSRLPNVNHAVSFGWQAFVKEYLIDRFDHNFFARPWKQVYDEYQQEYPLKDINHIKELHTLGYLPIKMKALPEGTLCPIKVPMMTITNTNPRFAWLVNYLETLISCCIWQPITSATIAHEYNKLLTKHAIKTTGSPDFVIWQGHDFSMRGLSSPESAITSGMGHLLSFNGSDTVPASYGARRYYGASGILGASVPATEHSVMCMGTKEGEIETFKRLLATYPTGVLSIVSDTWDLWYVITEILPAIKDLVLARDGKLVLRPDSGDPVDIICGRKHLYRDGGWWSQDNEHQIKHEEAMGVVELLWDIFGGKVNEYGYKELDDHIGSIYGDSITLERADAICERLSTKGFASTNVVFGVGSFTYQYNTRDTLGIAIKATYGELTHGTPGVSSHGAIERREIFKDPITDDGTKKSLKGLIMVYEEDGIIKAKDQCTDEEASQGLLRTIFLNGDLTVEEDFNTVRDRLKTQHTQPILT
jgi:nicotinamide phosphoribosyltransferase